MKWAKTSSSSMVLIRPPLLEWAPKGAPYSAHRTCACPSSDARSLRWRRGLLALTIAALSKTIDVSDGSRCGGAAAQRLCGWGTTGGRVLCEVLRDVHRDRLLWFLS